MNDRIGPAIGIDLGSTNTCVAIFQEGAVEIIPDEDGNRTMPSCVAFTQQGLRLIGHAARNQAALNLENTISQSQRLLGRRFGDVLVEYDMKQWPFRLSNNGGKPHLEVDDCNKGGETKLLLPEEICAMILTRAKQIAEAYLGKTVTSAVISIPAVFTFSQRQAVMDAAAIAGLNVLRLAKAPVLAAMSYAFEKKIAGQRNVVVFDLGGGSLNVATIRLDGDEYFEVMSVASDNDLGGDDFDSLMVGHFVDELNKTKNLNILDNKRALLRLRSACERAKRALSAASQASVEVDALDFCSTISRTCFEQLNEHLFRATLQPVESALRSAKLLDNKTDIHDVLLVGGSSRIPRVQELLREFFDDKTLTKSINADEAVAKGAAILAGCLSGDYSSNFTFLDVAPIALGIESPDGSSLEVMVKRNFVIPTTISQVFYVRPDQVSFPVKVYEGERPMAKDNNFLGAFELSLAAFNGINHRRKVVVTFNIDADFSVEVSAVDEGNGTMKVVTVNKGSLAEDDIERLKQEAEKYHLEEIRHKKQQQAKNNLEEYIFLMRKTVGEEKLGVDPASRRLVEAKCDEVQAVLDEADHHQAKSCEEMKRWLGELEQACDPVVRKACQRLLGIC